MSAAMNKPESLRVLDTVERLSEILFGLIMALTFTGSISIATSGREEVRPMLIGAIGCNLAWGIIDGFMYLLHDLVERNRALNERRRLRAAATAEEAHQIISSALPEGLAGVMGPTDLDHVQRWLARIPDDHEHERVNARSLRGALAVFLLVSLSTFPMVLPFIFLRDPVAALRTSHAVGLTMLFGVGAAYGAYAGLRAWLTGTSMVAIGVVLVAMTIALGG